MRIRDIEGEMEEAPNLTSFIDVMMVLLIFLMAVTTFRQVEREVEIQLPGLSSSQPLSGPSQQMIINIAEDGRMVVSGQEYAASALEELLTQVATRDPSREVLIRADERSIHRYFATVAGICRRAGVNEVKIGYVLQEPTPMTIQ
jgi:biopolymer transport protein ExbD